MSEIQNEIKPELPTETKVKPEPRPLLTIDINGKNIQQAYEDTIIRMISRSPYYAHILLQLKLQFIPNFPSAGVGISNGQIRLIIGSSFFLGLNEEQRVFVMMHEMGHIILGHLGTERSGNKEDHKIMNIAMDTAIHEILTQAKVLFTNDEDMNPCTVESLRKLVEDDTIKNNETTEYYFNFLKKLKEELKEKLKDFKFDEHDFTEGDPDSDAVDIGKALTVGLLEKAGNATGAGEIPSDALVTIDKFKKSVKNWRAILRRYTTSMVDVDTRVTRNKTNRRYGVQLAGKKKKFHPKVVTIVDTSGSMDQDRLADVWKELVRMEKQGYEIMVIEADAKVQKVKEFNSKTNINFTGGGGTLYQEALDVAAKLKPDVVIYLTDLDPADHPTKPRFPVIWAAVARGGYNPDFGVIIDITDGK
jgi:predicted metal-dependent peptidase